MKSSLPIIFLSFAIFFLVSCSEKIQFISQNTDSVDLYDKFELKFILQAEYMNPFDPEEIAIDAVFTSPGGKKWNIPAFYDGDSISSQWILRFSPNELGNWNYRLTISDAEGKYESRQRHFIAKESKFHGPIKVAKNKRYLQYADDTPFYGVGFWYNDMYKYRGSNKGRIQGTELDRLKELGVNFISTFITPLETMETGLGRYDQELCQRLDTIMNMCEDREMQLSLNIWFHNFISETVWTSFWDTNPYQAVCKSKDFFSSDEAWKYQEKLYRYFIARWGYSRSLAIWFIVDEVNGTDGWVSGDSLGAAKWGKKIHDYFQKHDPYGHPTTGTRSGGIKEWWQEGYEIFDLPGREIYEAQGFPINKKGKISLDDTHPLTYSYLNYAGEIRKLWNGWEKPCLIPETGYDHTYYEPSQPGYLAQYHNALWVSLACGTAMTPFWWAHGRFINDNMITHQIKNLRLFTDQISFSGLSNITPLQAKISNGDAFAIKSDQLIFGWAVNPKTDVTSEVISLSGLENRKYFLKFYHTWRGEFIEDKEVEIKNETLQFEVPLLKIERGHARYIGEDIAFVLDPI